MRVIALAGSPRYPSRSSSLLMQAQQYLNDHGINVVPWNLHNFDPADLLYARFDAPALLALREDLQGATGVMVSTPIYKASLSGGLKALFDVLPEQALEHKVVLPLVTGSNQSQMLAMDYALKPVLNALSAQSVLQGVLALDEEIYYQQNQPKLTPALTLRFSQAVETFLAAITRNHHKAKLTPP